MPSKKNLEDSYAMWSDGEETSSDVVIEFTYSYHKKSKNSPITVKLTCIYHSSDGDYFSYEGTEEVSDDGVVMSDENQSSEEKQSIDEVQCNDENQSSDEGQCSDEYQSSDEGQCSYGSEYGSDDEDYDDEVYDPTEEDPMSFKNKQDLSKFKKYSV